MVPERVAQGTRGAAVPLARALASLGVSANAVTILGFAITVAGAALLASGQLTAALVVLIVGSLADTLDGAIARTTGSASRLGAFLDSTFDRLSDAALMSAAVWLGATLGDPLLLWAALAALVASFGVSYVRAKAESLGMSASVGPAPREARIVILLLGVASWVLFASRLGFVVAVVVVAVLAAVTFVQRVASVATRLSRERN